MTRLLAAASMLALAACATGPQTGPGSAGGAEAPFRAEDFAWSAQPGQNKVRGEVAFRGEGRRWTCAGTAVGLTPHTPWSARRMQALYGSTRSAALPVAVVRARTVAEAGADYSRFVRTAACDAQNRFSFEGLPDGTWYVIARARPADGGDGEGFALMQRVEARGGDAVVVTLD